MIPKIVTLQQNVMDKNQQIANGLRERFIRAGVLTLNLVSSPGSGKTTFLEKTLTQLRSEGARAAALVGDLATDNDARRLANSGVPVKQIVTVGMCHLEAEMITEHLADWDIEALDYLFIENVGNLVCPSGYDLGESLRVVLLSVTEGEDKPLKYPPMFHSSDVAIITKVDIAAAVEFDVAAARANILAVSPEIQIFEVSAKTGQGMDAWYAFLAARREQMAARP
jgi:hydrogenase nickel incorporation protein HypB